MSEVEVVKRKRGRPKRFDPAEEEYQVFRDTAAEAKRVRDNSGKFIFSGGRKRYKKTESINEESGVTNPSKTLLFKLSEAREHVFGGIDSVISAASKIYDELEKLEEENTALKKRIEELEHVEATAEKIREWQRNLSKIMDTTV